MMILNTYFDMMEVIIDLALKNQRVTNEFLDEMNDLWNRMSEQEREFCNSFINIIVDIVRYNNTSEE